MSLFNGSLLSEKVRLFLREPAHSDSSWRDKNLQTKHRQMKVTLEELNLPKPGELLKSAVD